MDRGKIFGTAAGPATQDAGHPSRKTNLCEIVRHLARPPWRGQEKGPSLRAAGTLAHVGEVVGPGINELQHVVAARRIGYVEEQGTATQVELGDRIQRVVVDGDKGVCGTSQSSGVGELIEGRCRNTSHAGLGESHNFVEVSDQRVAVEERFRDEVFEVLRCRDRLPFS